MDSEQVYAKLMRVSEMFDIINPIMEKELPGKWGFHIDYRDEYNEWNMISAELIRHVDPALKTFGLRMDKFMRLLVEVDELLKDGSANRKARRKLDKLLKATISLDAAFQRVVAI